MLLSSFITFKLQFSDYLQSSSGDVKLVEGGKPLFKLKLKLNSTIYTKVIETGGEIKMLIVSSLQSQSFILYFHFQINESLDFCKHS